MTIDPILPTLVGVIFLALLVSAVLKFLKQPHMVAYILVGTLAGPHGLALMEDVDVIGRIGSVGVVLLLFLVGIEASPQRILTGWRVSLLGTILQIILSVAAVWAVGLVFDWSINRVILLGFVISLSSTAVILNVISKKDFVPPHVAEGTTNISIVQDIMLIPMLVIIGMLSGEKAQGDQPLWLQFAGGVFMVVLTILAIRNKDKVSAFSRVLQDDAEMQTMAALAICMGLALLSAEVGLSTALGAFVAGLIVSSFHDSSWAKDATESFRHILMAVFFMSIGMMLDLTFLMANLPALLALLLAVVLTNVLVNAISLRISGLTWREAIFAGAILSQIGEFSFVLAAIGLSSGVISGFAYQATVAVIALSLVTSPILINLAGRWFHKPRVIKP